MFLLRGLAVWLLIMLTESVHGTLRQIFLAPLVGDFTARRISFLTGMLMGFGLLFMTFAPYLAAKLRGIRTRDYQL
jgi:hypothetical protein